MAEREAQGRAGPRLSVDLIEIGKRAFDPSNTPENREDNVKRFKELIDGTQTWALLPTLNSLVKPGLLPTWLREPLLQALTLVPLRPDGVRGTMEFVFSVHPSAQRAATDAQQLSRSGASITHEAAAVVIKLLSTVPNTHSPQEWFGGIAPQLFRLLDGTDGQDLAKTAAQVIGFGILGKKQTGAPGSPGWNAFVHPLLERLNPSLKSAQYQVGSEQIIDLSKNQVLVDGEQLATALMRLKALTLTTSSPGLCRRVLKPVIVQLWVLSLVGHAQEHIAEKYCDPAKSLLRTYFQLFGKIEDMQPVIDNLLSVGCTSDAAKPWLYHQVDQSAIEVVATTEPADSIFRLSPVEVITRAETLVRFVCVACSSESISGIFLSLLRKWTASLQEQRLQDSVKTTNSGSEATNAALHETTEVTILQKLMELAPEKLVSQFNELVEVVSEMIRSDNGISLDDELTSVVLSLLNMIILAPSFGKGDVHAAEAHLFENFLAGMERSNNDDVSKTAKNLRMLLEFRDEAEPFEADGSAASARQIEDRRTYNLALNYITGDTGNPPPVVSEGLDMLSGLIVAQSPVLDITAVTVMLSSLLKDNEDYVNLRVIKIFTQIANKHPKTTTQELLEHYLDSQELLPTDVRLRFGEALVQVIEGLGEMFAGEIAERTFRVLLWIAGRRAFRPKTQARQARDERLARLKRDRAAGSQDEGEEDISDNDYEEAAESDRRARAVLTQILRGWEGKRGSEDIRMRTSALSLMGTALETNIAGIGPALVSDAIDSCVNVLSVEKEMESGILRRAAILVILGFVRALHRAKETGRSLGFGLTDSSREDVRGILKYIADTDNDGLVQQHARDVVESLETWQISSLLSQTADTGVRRLAGLRMNPAVSIHDGSPRRKPRIEEIE